MLHLGAAIGEDDPVLLVFNRGFGFERGGDGRNGCGLAGALAGAAASCGWPAARTAAAVRPGAELCAAGGRRGLFGLEEILVAKQNDEGQEGEA